MKLKNSSRGIHISNKNRHSLDGPRYSYNGESSSVYVSTGNRYSSLYIEETKFDRPINNGCDISMTDFPPLTESKTSSTPTNRDLKRDRPRLQVGLITTRKQSSKNRNHFPAREQDKSVLLSNARKTVGLSVDKISRSSSTKHRLLIMADSHSRDLGRYLSSTVDISKFNVLSVCKPGAKILEVMSGLESFAEGYTKHDVVVIIGGSNNVIKGTRTILMKSIINRLITLSRKTNVVLSGLPLRFDRNELNEDVHLCNINLYESVLSGKVEFLPLNRFERYNFTNHGQHLNKKGKFNLISCILNTCKVCLSRPNSSTKDLSFLG